MLENVKTTQQDPWLLNSKRSGVLALMTQMMVLMTLTPNAETKIDKMVLPTSWLRKVS